MFFGTLKLNTTQGYNCIYNENESPKNYLTEHTPVLGSHFTMSGHKATYHFKVLRFIMFGELHLAAAKSAVAVLDYYGGT